MGFVLEGVDGYRRRKATHLDLFQIRSGIVARTQFRKSPVLGDEPHMVVVCGLVWGLPGWRLYGVQDSQDDINGKDDGQGDPDSSGFHLCALERRHRMLTGPLDGLARKKVQSDALAMAELDLILYPLFVSAQAGQLFLYDLLVQLLKEGARSRKLLPWLELAWYPEIAIIVVAIAEPGVFAVLLLERLYVLLPQ